MKEYMNDINTFKDYATSIWVPDYFSEYVNSLNYEELELFYNQVKETLVFLRTGAYLIYKFKWIKDRNFTDLSKEIYLECLYNSEGFGYDIIKPEWENILYERYKDDEDVRNFFNY